MGAGQTEIQCRKCRETFTLEAGSCPHCGTATRNDRTSILVIAIGLIITVASVADLGALWPFMVLGIAAIALGGFLLKDKRDRIR